MLTEKKSLADGACNFCKRSEVSETGVGLKYPYNTVTHVEGNNTSVRFCDDCLKELLQKTGTMNVEIMELSKNEVDRITLRGFLGHLSFALAIVILLFAGLAFINLTKFDYQLYGLASSVIGGIALSYYCLFAVRLNRPIHYFLYPVYFVLTGYLFYLFGISMHSLMF